MEKMPPTRQETQERMFIEEPTSAMVLHTKDVTVLVHDLFIPGFTKTHKLKPIQSIIVRKTRRGSKPPTFQFPVDPFNRTQVNLYYRHTKPAAGSKQFTSIRRGAFEISVDVPTFTNQPVNATRPFNYYCTSEKNH
jgi:hypothetical protein